jgi:putative PEP-CTERM system histidine kinase
MALASLWGHAAAAILFGALSVWLFGRSRWDGRARMMMAATGATAIWALIAAIEGPTSMFALLSESLRNLAWLGYMYRLWRQGEGEQRTMSVIALYGVLAAVITALMSAEMLPLWLSGSPRLLNAAFFAALILRMIVTVGSLVLVHNLYIAATPDARVVIRMPMIALSVMWVYDLNLYTISYLADSFSTELMALRGVTVTLIAPLFGLAAHQSQRLTMRLSRSATFQSLSLAAIGGYLIAIVLITSALQVIAGEFARAAQVGFVFGTSVAALVLLPSARFRGWFRVKLSKHLFQHRYDYRAEWLRFTDTIGRPGEHARPLDVRVVQAIADITESPGGFLLIPDDNGTLILQTRWNWDDFSPPGQAANDETARYFAQTGRIVELDVLRLNPDQSDDEAASIPQWILSEHKAWAIVPLVHFDRLAGLVVLQRPQIGRTLDWEDFDLLRVVGRQVASYLAESRGQEALSHVQQFDEFNRRFAFIMHDIKNLVSQLSLVTRNAERHAGNPEFQADMISTLKNSTARMNDLLARLSQHNKVRHAEPAAMEAGPVIERVAASKRATHPIVIGGDIGLYLTADPARLEQAMSHLVQNAIDASPAIEPVCIMVRRIRDEAVIEVQDRGIGMSSHFIRHNLFKPFSSTKENGFGIGAFEARSLVTAMAGRIDVISREGEGSIFRIILPIARGTSFNLPEERALVA